MEYEEVSKRPGLIPHLNAAQIDAILDQICKRGEEQRIFFQWRPQLPDPDDDMLLELALASGCKTIVTANVRDFASVAEFGITALEPREFARILQES